jgi:hypothetical protein
VQRGAPAKLNLMRARACIQSYVGPPPCPRSPAERIRDDLASSSCSEFTLESSVVDPAGREVARLTATYVLRRREAAERPGGG